MADWIVWKPTENPPDVCPFCGSKAKRTKRFHRGSWRVDFRCLSRVDSWSIRNNAWQSDVCQEIARVNRRLKRKLAEA
jgi:hypothetical protein